MHSKLDAGITKIVSGIPHQQYDGGGGVGGHKLVWTEIYHSDTGVQIGMNWNSYTDPDTDPGTDRYRQLYGNQ